ncbi:MAG TPA: hypothetical protein VM260_24835 [Pirellula sp.]|nr:hypothetical protein [Pirellula sp.]
MFSKLILSFTAVVALGCVCPAAHAQGPFAFQFGYAQGYQNSFQNRLPTPPYFSVYPPVYYGRRFERPYGDSPYASFPQLRSSHDYHPVPKEAPVRTRTVMNPHVDHSPSVKVQAASNGEPVAVSPPRMGRTVEIINPYAAEQFASKSR